MLKIQSLMDIKVDLLPRFVTNKYIFDCVVTHKQTGIKPDLVSENQQIVEELHKPIISKLEKRKLYFFFKRQNFESWFTRCSINK